MGRRDGYTEWFESPCRFCPWNGLMPPEGMNPIVAIFILPVFIHQRPSDQRPQSNHTASTIVAVSLAGNATI